MAEYARRTLQANVARLAAGQPGARVLFFKYSTPVGRRPARWPVFAPFCALPEFGVVVIRRRPVDTVYSGFRRFYRGYRPELRGVVVAAVTYLQGRRHIGRQLRGLSREQYLEVRYAALIREPAAVLGAIAAFAGVDYCPIERLMPDTRLTVENGKWRQALRRRLGGQ